MWLIILSDQLRVVGLVGHYPTNYLMRREPILRWPKPLPTWPADLVAVRGISGPFGPLSPAGG